MSYARWGQQGSDVYVYRSSRGIECCGCRLRAGSDEDVVFDHPAQMLGHLEWHRTRGDAVPESALERLRRELVDA